MIDVGRRLRSLSSTERAGGGWLFSGGARERRNCELCGHGSRVHVGPAMLIKRIVYVGSVGRGQCQRCVLFTLL